MTPTVKVDLDELEKLLHLGMTHSARELSLLACAELRAARAPAVPVDLDSFIAGRVPDDMLNALDSILASFGYRTPFPSCRALIAEVRSVRAPWILCSERMPGEEEHVLAYSPPESDMGRMVFEAFPKHDFAASHRWQRGGGRYCSDADVTHWMPLPAPPETP